MTSNLVIENIHLSFDSIDTESIQLGDSFSCLYDHQTKCVCVCVCVCVCIGVHNKLLKKFSYFLKNNL